MNGIHDMGGMHGFGPVKPEANEPLFHTDWEARIFALWNLMWDQQLCNAHEGRWGVEQMAPATYLRSSYYERWVASLEYTLVLKGILTTDELDVRTEFLGQDSAASLPQPKDAVTSMPVSPSQPVAPSDSSLPRFTAGDAVITRNMHPVGHTRLPRYARGKRGIIHRVCGPRPFPDTHAHGLAEHPHVVYGVRFEARELWGDAANPHGTVNLDLWESYLEPAPD